MNQSLLLQDKADISDLAAYLTRAKKLDAEGAVKLKSFGDVLAVYVSPIYSGSLLGDGVTVMGLRTIRLATSSQIDGTFEISSILERLANLGESLELFAPAAQVRVPWSGITPPREGWIEVGALEQEQITQWSKDGIAGVASALPETIGASIAAKVRQQIWGRAASEELGLPTAAAFALSGLGFMQPGETVRVFSAANWLRVSSQYGHVLSKKLQSS